MGEQRGSKASPSILSVLARRRRREVAAEQSGKILSVAENFRRDPINRLVRALLDDGAIGQRQFMMETNVVGCDTIFITPWRHMKLTGAVAASASARRHMPTSCNTISAIRLPRSVRYASRDRTPKLPGAGPGGFWEAWVKDFPDVIKPTGEDAMFGTINFRNGAVGQWVFHNGGHGQPFHDRMVFGTRGSITAPGDRNGRPVRLTLDDGTDIDDERVLEYAPNYRLSPLAAELFGGQRIWKYDFDFVTTDRKIIAFRTSIRGMGGPGRGRKSTAQWPSARSPWSIRCSNPRSRGGR